MFFNKVPSVNFDEVEKNAKIIDVREPSEFKRGHLKNAKNVPLDEIGNYKNEGKIYVICASGVRSKRAVKILIKNGVNAVNINGGMMNAR